MNKDQNAVVGLLVGMMLGAPVSYFLQSGLVRAKMSLGSYLGHLPQLLAKYPQDMLPPVVISCAILGVAGWFIGRKMGRPTP